MSKKLGLMQDFVDIHTHSNENKENVWQLCSLFPKEEVLQLPFSVGIHPWKIETDWQKQMQSVIEKSQDSNCRAIGECGLDKTVRTPLAIQQEIFKVHIDLANELEKPLIVHCVKAYEELLKFVHEIKVPIILHDFGKSVELGKQLQEKRIYLSVGKAVFRPSFEKVLLLLDKELLFLETDDSQYSIIEIYEQVAQIFNCELLTLQRQIQENFKRAF